MTAAIEAISREVSVGVAAACIDNPLRVLKGQGCWPVCGAAAQGGCGVNRVSAVFEEGRAAARRGARLDQGGGVG